MNEDQNESRIRLPYCDEVKNVVFDLNGDSAASQMDF